jgi:plastocyanin
MRFNPFARAVVLAVVALFAMAACGNGGSEGEEASGDVFEVSAQDFEFDPPELEVPEGDVTVRFTNNGTVAHTFTLEENESVDTGNVEPGDSKTITFKAPTEETDFVCTIHYESNDMEGKIRPQ